MRAEYGDNEWGFRKNRGFRKGFLWLLLILPVVAALAFAGKNVIGAMDRIACLKAQAMVNGFINEALTRQIAEDKSRDGLQLLEVVTNDDGQVEFVQANTYEINRLITGLAGELQRVYAESESMQIGIPVGSLLNSRLMSQWGPEMKLRVSLLGAPSMRYMTEFEAQGINQTKYKLYIEAQTRITILSPVYKKELTMENRILAAEAVIVGRVPSSYVMVPQDDMIDGMGMGD